MNSNLAVVPYDIDDTLFNQLRDLFSTPKGSVAIYPDYGFDFTVIDTMVGKAIDLQELKLDIKNTLQKYVKRVNVEKSTVNLYYNPAKGHLLLTIDNMLINLTERPKCRPEKKHLMI